MASRTSSRALVRSKQPVALRAKQGVGEAQLDQLVDTLVNASIEAAGALRFARAGKPRTVAACLARLTQGINAANALAAVALWELQKDSKANSKAVNAASIEVRSDDDE